MHIAHGDRASRWEDISGKMMLGVESDQIGLQIENIPGSWYRELGMARILESSAAKSKVN